MALAGARPRSQHPQQGLLGSEADVAEQRQFTGGEAEKLFSQGRAGTKLGRTAAVLAAPATHE